MVTKAAPRTPDELLEDLADAKTLERAFATPESSKAYLDSYAASFLKHDPDVQKELKDQHDKAVDASVAKALERIPVNGRIPTSHDERNKERRAGVYGTFDKPGSFRDGDFKSFGQFIQTIVDSQKGGSNPTDLVTKVLNEGTGADGGFTVPEEFRAEIMMMMIEDSVVRPRATIIPMTREQIAIPTIRDTTHASTIHGGVQAFWTPENTAVTNTQPTFGQVRLNAHKLAGGTQASMELLNDSAISIETLLMRMFADATGWFEDDAFFNGTGAGQPVGIINADALITVGKETGQAASTIVWENVIKMFARMLPQSMSRGVWVANQTTIPQLGIMSLSVGTGGSAIWLQNGQGALPTTILGRPIIYTEKVQTLGTAGDLFFVDFSQYLIGDRMSMEISNSSHFAFKSDQMTWKFIHRVDGKPWMDSALTPRNGDTLSAFINLTTRS